MRRSLLSLSLLLMVAASLEAQGLRDKLSALFIFGSGQDPLFLAGSGDPNNPDFIQAHGRHLVPAAVAGNATVISFITTSIGGNVPNIPVGATSSGLTFRLEGGVPVRTSESPGPIFGERAQTLGRGRVLVGANVSRVEFKTLRGVNLDDIRLNFTHQNITNAEIPGCDAIFEGDCSRMGFPDFENDVMQFRLSLDLDLTVTSFFLTYGLLDNIDIGVVLPIASTSFRGTSEAQLIPFGGPTVSHFFEGTPDSPGLSSTRFEEGSASGIGDIAARLKINVGRSERTGFSILADARFPTGSEEDLLGSGRFAARGLGIVSGQFGNFSPHANVGYLFREGNRQNDAVLITGGFDHLLASWVTLAADVIAELQAGDSNLRVPEPVTIETPFRRAVESTTIPDGRDDLVNASFGFKFTTGAGVTIVANSIWPLNRGGLRPNVLWTAGLEYNF